ncbi:MAG: hypothetical protein IPH06_06040 [Alphaproteobacteria bacterium]|nr:hypothetical protein [Alphaproteobacteria bacterium]QQS57580.1 MAG: hypothetical protein IPN28_01805 [Alphaproteobacteria bacterium]
MKISSTSGSVPRNDDPVCEIEFLKSNGYAQVKSKWTPKNTYDLIAEDRVFGFSELERWTLGTLLQNTQNLETDRDLCSYGEVLAHCFGLINESPAARLMIQEAVAGKWQITLFDLKGGDYWIDVEEKLILLDSNALTPAALGRSVYFKNAVIVTLIKALRDIWQEKRHGGFDEKYRTEFVLTMERIRSADCDVLSILVAWELRSGAYPDLWRHLIGSENGDMAMAFSGFLERNPSGQFNGQALAASFRQWFRCEHRVNTCDHNTLENLDDILRETQEQNPFGERKPKAVEIEMLSCLPDRTAYLQGYGAEILSDPLFSGMDDPINQSHLFHILYDLEATIIENVPFRDSELAKKIFPMQPLLLEKKTTKADQ